MRTRNIRIDSKNLSLVFSFDKVFGPEYLYFGPKKNKNFNFNKFKLTERSRYGVSFNKPLLSTFGGYEHHEYSHIFKNANGSFSNTFVLKSVNENANKCIPVMPSGRNPSKTVSFLFEDKEAKIQLELFYSVYFDSDVFSCYTVTKNLNKKDVHVLKASSLSLPINETDLKVITFNGSWAQERFRNEALHKQGLLINSSVNGSSSHLHNPLTYLQNKKGHTYGFNLIYGGNHKTSFEAGFVERMNVIVGINDFLFDWTLKHNEEFVTPEAIFTFGNNENEVMKKFHTFTRNNIMQPQWANKARPIVFNNWEGTYFDFTSEKIVNIAKKAAEIGAEMFVLDDGWFGARNSDAAGLGDWISNKEKTDGGLDKLSKRVKSLGMKFGIWMEPEMVNPDSDLYRAHKEYAMEIPGRNPTLWRNQLMLDLTSNEVKEFVYNTICHIIDEADADYVKWDYNRQMTEIFGKDFPTGEYFHRYMLAFYDIISRLKEKYPNVLFEGCAGGGGRFDLGMLSFFSQIWTSDDTDPKERIHIQEGTLCGYPQITMTCHVSAIPIHTTKRTVSLSDMFNVCISGNLGYELDPTKLDEQTLKELKKQICFYKQARNVIQLGQAYRLSYKDIFKGIIINKDDEYYLYIYLLKNGNFKVKLPQIFDNLSMYKVDNIEIPGSVLNKELPISFINDLRIDSSTSCHIGTKVIHIKRM